MVPSYNRDIVGTHGSSSFLTITGMVVGMMVPHSYRGIAEFLAITGA